MLPKKKQRKKEKKTKKKKKRKKKKKKKKKSRKKQTKRHIRSLTEHTIASTHFIKTQSVNCFPAPTISIHKHF